jgi:hypothetical protein
VKIAIVGSEPETWHKVPELSKEWELWRFSRRNWNKPPVAHRWFELHHPRNYLRYEQSCPGYTKFLQDTKAITYRAFPFERLLDEFGPYFFTWGQIPWIMAYAITLDPDEIGLWGIEPAGDYKPQHAEVQHFAQVARDRGITVTAPEGRVLIPRKLYALEKDFSHEAAIQAIFNPHPAAI